MIAMPVYEYVCSGCGHAFEALIYGEERPACPECEGTELEKQLSSFSTRGATESATRPAALPPGACGTCGDPRGPGACSLD